jgi:transcriptional regulator with XRE-family HTH domain
MQSSSLRESLVTLGLNIQELADLLGINVRTVQRWLSGEVDIPKSIECVVNAWMYLNQLGLPWRPDGFSVSLLSVEEVKSQLILHMENTKELAKIIKKVQARGGPAAPWSVDLSAKKATLGDVWVRFYILSNGSFSPQSYGRFDKFPDVDRDQSILEDAYVCIAEAIATRNKKYKDADWSSVDI